MAADEARVRWRVQRATEGGVAQRLRDDDCTEARDRADRRWRDFDDEGAGDA